MHDVPRARPDKARLAEAIKLLKLAKRPLIIAGGGTRYSGAEGAVAQFAIEHGIPITETIAGKSTVPHDHPAYAGPIGVVGSTSANALAAEADVIVAIGTRLMDFTTDRGRCLVTTPSSSPLMLPAGMPPSIAPLQWWVTHWPRWRSLPPA